MKLLEITACSALFAYAAFLIFIGLLGLFIPAWGPMRFEALSDDAVLIDRTSEVWISMMHQFRFIKTMELAIGFFVITHGRLILSHKGYNLLFLSIVFLGIFSRVYSMLVDGKPRSFYFLVLGMELFIALSVLIYTQIQFHKRSTDRL
jgi:Domain of unknown function (DUF4345)